MPNRVYAKDKNSKEVNDYYSVKWLTEEVFHDFKNILGTISGLSQLSIILTDSEEVKKNLMTITKAAFDFKDGLDRLYYLKDDLIIDEKKPKLLKNLLYFALDMVSYRCKSKDDKCKDIKIKAELNSDAIIKCNEYDIKQSILNIIINGLDALDEVKEKDKILEIKLYDVEDKVVIEIFDNGIGIPEENLNLIFKPYFTTKGYNGNGLGLNMAKNIFEDHLGTISVESQIDVGTKFIISLPIMDVEI